MTHPRLPEAFFRGASRGDVRSLNTLLEPGGLSIKKRGANYLLRPTDSVGSMLELVALGIENGSLSDASIDLLRNDQQLLDETEASEIAEHFRSAYSDQAPPTQLHALAVELMANVDAVQPLERAIEPDIKFYRLVTTRNFHLRDILWRAMAKSQRDGTSWMEMSRGGEWPTSNLASGTVVASAAHWVTAPIIARAQPLVAAFTTARGAEVIMVPPGLWTRPPVWSNWPTGSFGMRLQGSGEAIYKTRNKKVPKDLADKTLSALVAGADDLITRATDPAKWIAQTGTVDVTEQSIAWSSLDLGFTALNELGRNWGSDEGLWTAYRVLGILQGMWDGTVRGSGLLASLMHPDTIQESAVKCLRPKFYQDWAEDIVENWRTSLGTMFRDTDLDSAVERVADLRNLVHGTGGTNARRAERLQTLIEMEGDGMQLVQDIAALWWMALLLNPGTHAVAGQPPEHLPPRTNSA